MRQTYVYLQPHPPHRYSVLSTQRLLYPNIFYPPASSFQSTKRTSQGAMSSRSQRQRYVSSCSCLSTLRVIVDHRPHTTSIHILDDDSLLNIFHLYRPSLLGEDQGVDARIAGGGRWSGECWWYGLAHVCQRWRDLILASASYLGLCLVCTYRTPVAYMLAHSPPLPLAIDYIGRDIAAEDEEGIILALEQRDRVRRIRLSLPVLKLQKLIMTMDGEYPTLEYLILANTSKEKGTISILPETLETPRLRHLAIDCSIPIRFQSLTTAAGLVTLSLALHHPSTYFQPAVILQSLSLMPKLEILAIVFHFVVTNRDVERQLMRTPIMTHVTHPSLRLFAFQVDSVYSEAVLSRITAPRLENLQISYPRQLTYSVPKFVQFIGRTKSLKFNRAEFHFDSKRVYVYVKAREANMPLPAFSIVVNCSHLDWQVSSMAQIFNALGQILSVVEHLTLLHKVHSQSSEEHNEVDRAEWHKLLRSFGKVKTLRIHRRLAGELSRCLRLDDGDHALELLPELQELTYSGSGNANSFTPFIDARQNAGRPITLIKS